VINLIPKDKLILLDKMVPGIEGEYGAVYEILKKIFMVPSKKPYPI